MLDNGSHSDNQDEDDDDDDVFDALLVYCKYYW